MGLGSDDLRPDIIVDLASEVDEVGITSEAHDLFAEDPNPPERFVNEFL